MLKKSLIIIKKEKCKYLVFAKEIVNYFLPVTNNSQTSTPNTSAILNKVSTAGWLSLVHHFETAAVLHAYFFGKPDISLFIFYKNDLYSIETCFLLCHKC
jgi:hypothetical protein